MEECGIPTAVRREEGNYHFPRTLEDREETVIFTQNLLLFLPFNRNHYEFQQTDN